MPIAPARVAPPSAALATNEICAEVEWLTAVGKRAEPRLCNHLAELADRFDRRAPDLLAYANLYQLASERFAMRERGVRERVRIGRALRGLPLISRAFAAGELGYAKVREVTRVAGLAQAVPDTEAMWLATAGALSLRELERRVAESAESVDRGHASPCDSAHVRPASADSIELQVRLPAATLELLEQAMDGARREATLLLSDAEAFEAVALAALVTQAARSRVDAIDQSASGRGGHAMTPGGRGGQAGRGERGGHAMTPEGRGGQAGRGGRGGRGERGGRGGRGERGGHAMTPGGHAGHTTQGKRGGRQGHAMATADHGIHGGHAMTPGDHAMTPGGHGGHLIEEQLSAEGATVLTLMSSQHSWHPDELQAQCALRISEVCSALVELELRGLVHNGFRGYQRVRPVLHA